MIPIRIGKIPKLLVEHKNSTVPNDANYKPTYENLSKKAKEELKTSLLKDQDYICAYCMKSIDENTMSIEHFCSKSRYNGTIKGFLDLSLDYQNLLAVCENTGEHCDKFRSQKTEKIEVLGQSKTVQKEFLHLPNPKGADMKNIRFDYGKSSFKISCTDKNIETELEELLNLNGQTLRDNRKNVWNKIEQRLSAKTKPNKTWVSSEAVIREAQKIYDEYKPNNKGKNKPYCGFVCYMLLKIFGNQIKPH